MESLGSASRCSPSEAMRGKYAQSNLMPVKTVNKACVNILALGMRQFTKATFVALG